MSDRFLAVLQMGLFVHVLGSVADSGYVVSIWIEKYEYKGWLYALVVIYTVFWLVWLVWIHVEFYGRRGQTCATDG